MSNLGMEETKKKPSKIRGFAVIVGAVVLALGLIANIGTAANVIANFEKAPASASGFLAGFALLVGLPIVAIVWGLRKPAVP